MTKTIEDQQEQYFDQIITAIEKDHIDHFRKFFTVLPPYDQATFFLSLSDELRKRLYTYLSPREMANILENVELEKQENYLLEMDPNYVVSMLSAMYVDNAVDVLNELSADQIASYLAMMDEDDATEIKALLHYEEKTAGSIMTTEYVSIESHQTVKEAMKILRHEAPTAETIYYIFVIDHNKKLVGVISLRDLIVADGNDTIMEHMNHYVVSVSVSEDQEVAAKLMRDYDFLALPVTDFHGRLVGIITHDDIADVIDEEASEDYSKFAAIRDVDTAIDENPISAAKKRLPWLIILLFLGMLTASLIGRFEDTLSSVAILAVFMPLIAGMAGNTGTQSLAVVVRGIATGDFGDEGKWRLIMREAGTGIITGATCGIVITLIIYIWKGTLFLGLLVGFSLFCTLIVATVAGAIVPLIMQKLKIDPAVASGPFIQTVNDLISMLIYFSLATTFMGYLL